MFESHTDRLRFSRVTAHPEKVNSSSHLAVVIHAPLPPTPSIRYNDVRVAVADSTTSLRIAPIVVKDADVVDA